jgi:nickel-dependent lactate racemase
MRDEDVFFLVANGLHGALKRPALAKKLGPQICDRFVVMRHDPHQNLARVGGVAGLDEVWVNRFLCEADLKIGITGVMPHFMCGLSGGGKIVMPGACGFETVAATHAHTVEGPPARVGVVEGNAMRRVIEGCAARVGLEFCVNCVFNSDGALSAVFCGAPADSHRAAAECARRAYATEVACGADVAVFNAFPKDTEFIQAMAALNVWAERQDPERALVRPGGSIVAITACSEGLGAHGLIEHGRPQFRRRDRHSAFSEILRGRNLLLLAPKVGTSTVHLYYPPRTMHFRQWGPLRGALEGLHPDGARVAVYPTSSLQLDRAALERPLDD